MFASQLLGSHNLSLKEELRVFPATLLFWSSLLKMELSRIWLRGLDPGKAFTPLAKKSHFYSSHQLFLCSVALAQVDAQLYSLLKQTMNVRTNAFRTGNTILGYACLLCFHNFGKFTEQEAKWELQHGCEKGNTNAFVQGTEIGLLYPNWVRRMKTEQSMEHSRVRKITREGKL